MAATLTDDLTRVSVAEIEKWDEGPDGTVYVYGRCTTPDVDTDEQVVASEWSGPALKEYLATAPTVRVQHNPQRDPAGSAVRVDVNRDGDGAHWLKAAVDEPVAQRLVKKGHLRAFSVGIARPVIERDMTGKARGGIIKGGKIVEVSLVDSPANRSCFLEIAKSAADGTPEFTGKMVADDEVIQKALGGDVLTKSAMTDTWTAPDLSTLDVSSYSVPGDLNVTITPDDVMRLMQQKFVSQHYDELAVKAVAEAEDALLGKDHREFSADERRHQAGQGNALPDGSYPIPDADALRRAGILARSGHGNVAAARRLIARRARELGVANPLDESDDVKKSASAETEVTVNASADGLALTGEQAKGLVEKTQAALLKQAMRSRRPADQEPTVEKAADAPAEQAEAVPDVTKDPAPKPVKKAKKKPKKMPPWLKDGDSDSKGSDGDKDDGDDSSKSAAPEACKSFLDHVWVGTDTAGAADVQCSKCHTTPAQAAGVAGTHDMSPAPVKDLLESQGPACTKGATPASASGAVAESMKPVPAHREPDGAPAEAFERDAGMEDGDAGKAVKFAADLAPDPEVAALLRFKQTGTDEDLGRLHDLMCPAYHPDTVAKYHPYADMGTLIDSGAWQRRTLAAAAGPMEAALKMQEVWQAALLLKTADAADLNDFRLELHKAFRDANPGPGSYPTPGCVMPGRFARPVLTDGRAANGTDYGTPNSSPQVATTAPDAQSFDRPPLTAGHQTPSPSHMKGDGQYPHERGVPVQLSYAQAQREAARQALVRMHHHLARQFPEACPIDFEGPAQPERHAVPVPAGIGKSADDAVPSFLDGGSYVVPASAAAALKATPEQDRYFDDIEVAKSFKKMRKKLGKKVLSGKMTVDEARAKMGRQFAQKGDAALTDMAVEQVRKGIMPIEEVRRQFGGEGGTAPVPAPLTPAPSSPPVAAAFDPEVIKSAVAEATTELKDLLVKQQEAFTAKLAEQQKVIDAIADQPDPSTAAFSGLAFQPQVIKSRRPAAVPDQAEYAARAQAMIRRNLTTTYETHSDPYVREAAAKSLASMGVGTGAEAPMT